MFRRLALAIGAALLIAGGSASAATILAFGQSGNGSPITATTNGLGGTQGGTTIRGIDVPVTVSSYASPIPITPFPAFLNLHVTSASTAQVIPFVQEIGQEFSGSFSIRSAPGGAGINYLSGVFDDVFVGLGSGASVSASTPGRMVVFESDILTGMVEPLALSFGFTNIRPAIGPLCGPVGDRTICAFTGNVSGNMSAETVAIPTPGSLPLFLGSLIMAGIVGQRRAAARR